MPCERPSQVYAAACRHRHYCGLLDLALWWRIFALCLALGLALVVAFSTGGFWPVVEPLLDQAAVYYTGDALLVFEGSQPGEELMWSTSPTINAEFEERLVPANVQFGEDDQNNDGKPEFITFLIDVQTTVPVVGVKALLQFKYQLDSSVMLEMYGLAYVAASSPSPGGALYVQGDLLLDQQTEIQQYKYNGNYNYPILDFGMPNETETAQAASMLQFESIFGSYNSRNYTTVLGNQYQVWKAASGSTFQVELRVQIPPNQQIWYRPTVIQMLKSGWIQFLATYIVFWWGVCQLNAFAFQNHIFKTRVTSDTTPSTQKF